MIPGDTLDDVKNAERELRSFIYYCHKLVWLYDKIKQIDDELSSFGLSSPKIRSTEEAKYQRGTQIYSDVPLLEKITEQDDYKSEYYDLNRRCLKIQKTLVTLNDNEVDLLYLHIERNYSYRQMAVIKYSNKDRIMQEMLAIYEKFAK